MRQPEKCRMGAKGCGLSLKKMETRPGCEAELERKGRNEMLRG
jgi:hypothetical protein